MTIYAYVYEIINAGTQQLKMILNLPSTHAGSYAVSSPVLTSERRATQGFVKPIGSNEIPLSHQDCPMRSTETISSSRSSNDGFNSTWDNCKRTAICRHSLEDTADIQSYDWSSNAHNDTRKGSSMCLYDELAIASGDHTVNFANVRSHALYLSRKQCKYTERNLGLAVNYLMLQKRDMYI